MSAVMTVMRNFSADFRQPEKVSETDPVIAEIEKFMFECENITKPHLKNNDKSLDIENLLNILINGNECDLNKITSKEADKIENNGNSLSNKKRKIKENSGCTEAKKSKLDERKMCEKKELKTNNNKRKAEGTDKVQTNENNLLLIKGKIYDDSDCIKLKKLKNTPNYEQIIREQEKCKTKTNKQKNNDEKKKCEKEKSKTEPKKFNNIKRKTKQTLTDKMKTSTGRTESEKVNHGIDESKKIQHHNKTDRQKDENSGGGNKTSKTEGNKAGTRSSEAEESTCVCCSSSHAKKSAVCVNVPDKISENSSTANSQEVKRESLEECIDLTKDNSLYLCLNFAKFSDLFLESCEKIPIVTKIYAVISTVFVDLHFPTERKAPTVHREFSQSVVDLTGSDDDVNFPQMKMISEKECANEILHFIEKLYRIYPISQTIEKEISEVLASDDYCFKSYSQAKVFGCELIANLGNKGMRNFDITRILDTVVVKLEQKCKIFISPAVIALYLYIMLNANVESCNNRLLQDFLREATSFVQMKKVKLEQENSSVNGVITEEQLNQLRHQMEQYRLICMRQETYFCCSQDVSQPKNNSCRGQQFLDKVGDCQSIPENGELEKHIKEELLDHQLEQLNNQN